MSMVINLVEDHNIYLCEGGPVYNGGVQPAPITYLTQWVIEGNSEVHGQQIWSCGEYNATDGKYHILVKSQGGSIADIALDEPLRKVNNVADTIEFPSETDGKALVTRNLALLSTTKFVADRMDSQNKLCLATSKFSGADYDSTKDGNILCNKIEKGLSLNNARKYDGECFALQMNNVYLRNGAIEQTLESYQSYFDNLGAIEVVYQLATPTTELVDAPQIAEAESYTCIISQGGKAVSWSEFLYTLNYLLTDSENNLLVDSENYQLTVQS